ncbi:hypothetical protein QT381_00355 [Galbitalea sp. SE-J8]|uniref:hypothetical protein n=1 Tax=Galbitalea sp. SE-J8 TaxID=3054952 RepID=UPI00259C7152|nr:hypothetical protein [Galbitalea sp. SE-J8]MDM4761458.1 hypothetical protein [Galbitalea sp. SE-J8]
MGFSLLMAGLLVVGGVVPTADAKTRKIATSTSASVTRSVTAGGSAIVAARVKLKPGNRALKRVRVVVQMRPVESTAWITIARVRTDKRGKASFKTQPLSANVDTRVLYKGSAKYRSSSSTVRRIVVAQGLRITGTSASALNAGDPVLVSGTATAPLVGSPLELQVRFGSSELARAAKSWATISTGLVGGDGSFAISAAPMAVGTAEFRAVFRGSKSLSAAESNSALVALSLSDAVAITSSAVGIVMVGQTVTFTGTASPARAGTEAGLYYQKDGSTTWTSAAPATTFDATGHATVTIAMPSAGVRNYSFRITSGTSSTKVYSALVQVATYSWFSLDSALAATGTSGSLSAKSGLVSGSQMSGRGYTTIRSDTVRGSLWRLGGRCVSFQAARAVLDGGDELQNIGFTARLDAQDEIEYDDLWPGDAPEPITLDVTGVSELSLILTLPGNYDLWLPTTGIWASPQVLCTAKP